MLGRSGDVTGRPDAAARTPAGHGGPYGDLNRGSIDVDRLRVLLAGLPLPRSPDGRLVLAIDVSACLRSDARARGERLLVPIHNRGKTSTPDNRPAGWKQQMNRWDRLHYVRVAVIIAAFVQPVTPLT